MVGGRRRVVAFSLVVLLVLSSASVPGKSSDSDLRSSFQKGMEKAVIEYGAERSVGDDTGHGEIYPELAGGPLHPDFYGGLANKAADDARDTLVDAVTPDFADVAVDGIIELIKAKKGINLGFVSIVLKWHEALEAYKLGENSKIYNEIFDDLRCSEIKHDDNLRNELEFLSFNSQDIQEVVEGGVESKGEIDELESLFRTRATHIGEAYESLRKFDTEVRTELDCQTSGKEKSLLDQRTQNYEEMMLKDVISQVEVHLFLDHYATKSWLNDQPTTTDLADSDPLVRSRTDVAQEWSRYIDTLDASEDFSIHKIDIPPEWRSKDMELQAKLYSPAPDSIKFLDAGTCNPVQSDCEFESKKATTDPDGDPVVLEDHLYQDGSHYVKVAADHPTPYIFQVSVYHELSVPQHQAPSGHQVIAQADLPAGDGSTESVDPIPIPEPEISIEIQADGDIEPGEPFQVIVEGENRGGASEWQSLAVSLPQFESAKRVEIVNHDLDRAKILEEGTSGVGASYGGEEVTLSHVLVEGDAAWDRGESHEITLEVTPPEEGEYEIRAKSVALKDAIWTAAPERSSDTPLDQQNEHVRTIQVDVGGSNNPPNEPTLDSPKDGASETALSPTLEWSASDSDGDNLWFDLHLGTSSNPSQIASPSGTQYSVDGLNPGTTYYWKVVAYDGQASTGSKVHSFTTDEETGSIDIDNPRFEEPVVLETYGQETPKLEKAEIRFDVSGEEVDGVEDYDVRVIDTKTGALVGTMREGGGIDGDAVVRIEAEEEGLFRHPKGPGSATYTDRLELVAHHTGTGEEDPPVPMDVTVEGVDREQDEIVILPSPPRPFETITMDASHIEEDAGGTSIECYDWLVWKGDSDDGPVDVMKDVSGDNLDSVEVDLEGEGKYGFDVDDCEDASPISDGRFWPTPRSDTIADLSISNFDVTDHVFEGQSVQATVEVANTAPAQGHFLARFLADGVPIEIESEEADPAEDEAEYDSETISMTLPAGDHEVCAEVELAEGTTKKPCETISVEENDPPTEPRTPSPGDGATSLLPADVTLDWESDDPNGHSLDYKLYIEKGDPTPDRSLSVDGGSYTPNSLETGATYYWKVVARDSLGASTSGPVWSFSTAVAPEPRFSVTPDSVLEDQPFKLDATDSRDPDGSIQSFKWGLPGGGSATGSTVTHVVDDPGVYTLSVIVTDEDGLTGSTHRTLSVQVDEPPRIQIESDSEPESTGWWDTTIEAQLTCTDQEWTQTTLEYRRDGGLWQRYSENLTFTEGVHPLQTRCTDKAGNLGWRNQTLRVDTTAPVSDIMAPAASGNHGWYTSPFNITLVCSDTEENLSTSGCSTTRWNHSNGDGEGLRAGVDYTPSNLTISREGNTTACAASTDLARNTGNKTCYKASLDESDPILDIWAEGEEGRNGWYVSPVNVTLECRDEVAGVDRTTLSVDDGPRREGETFELRSQGNRSLQAECTDRAGLRTTEERDLKIDHRDPNVTIDAPRMAAGDYVVDWEVEDHVSGLAEQRILFRLIPPNKNSGDIRLSCSPLTDGGQTKVEGSCYLNPDDCAGEYRYQIVVGDQAGNLHDKVNEEGTFFVPGATDPDQGGCT